MATSKNNVLTHGLSGTVGDLLVFRNKGGKVIVANKPKERTSEYTEGEKAHQQLFQRATLYGKSVLADPTKKAAYNSAAKDGQSAYNVAVADYFSAPDIKEVDLSAYTGAVGSTIKIKAIDDFKVAKVFVRIATTDGSLIEEGNAVLQADGLYWLYTATQLNNSPTGDKITVTAWDLPNNSAVKEKVL